MSIQDTSSYVLIAGGKKTNSKLLQLSVTEYLTKDHTVKFEMLKSQEGPFSSWKQDKKAERFKKVTLGKWLRIKVTTRRPFKFPTHNFIDPNKIVFYL